jgi:hypothetical protein
MTRVYVTTEVEVDLSEISTEELAEELEGRNDYSATCSDEFVQRAFELLRAGRDGEALGLLRTEVQDRLGRIL